MGDPICTSVSSVTKLSVPAMSTPMTPVLQSSWIGISWRASQERIRIQAHLPCLSSLLLAPPCPLILPHNQLLYTQVLLQPFLLGTCQARYVDLYRVQPPHPIFLEITSSFHQVIHIQIYHPLMTLRSKMRRSHERHQDLQMLNKLWNRYL